MPKLTGNAMIYDKLDNIGLYFDAESDFVKAVEFARSFTGENGRYELDGDRLFAMVSEYKTGPESERLFEAHRKYADVQILLSGREKLGVLSLDDKNVSVEEEYDEGKDIAFYSSEVDYSRVVLVPGEFVVFYPEDCHKPGCSVDLDEDVRKIVIKVLTPDGRGCRGEC
ncbi:MAG: YhcH/YjgK/YiaL family protein [Sedimentisphaerales bacterium]|nr:YhcH/YjgK/YiaL family protein [Sedimentisphaerales bacterium]